MTSGYLILDSARWRGEKEAYCFSSVLLSELELGMAYRHEPQWIYPFRFYITYTNGTLRHLGIFRDLIYIIDRTSRPIKATTPKYILEIDLTTAPGQRLRLALPFLPPNHEDQPERRGYPPRTLLLMQLPIDGLVRQQHVPRDGPRLAVQDSIPLPHGLQILHQRKRVGKLHHDILHVDRQHLEPRTGQQPANVPDVRERRHMRRHAAAPLQVRELQRPAQLEQRLPAEHGREEGAVGLEDRVHLRQQRGEVVDPVDRERGEHRVERVGFVREGLQVRDHLPLDGQVLDAGVEGQVGVAVEQRPRGLDAGQPGDAVARRDRGRGLRVVGVRVGRRQGARDVAAVGAEVEDVGEGAFDVLLGIRLGGLAIDPKCG